MPGERLADCPEFLTKTKREPALLLLTFSYLVARTHRARFQCPVRYADAAAPARLLAAMRGHRWRCEIFFDGGWTGSSRDGFTDGTT